MSVVLLTAAGASGTEGDLTESSDIAAPAAPDLMLRPPAPPPAAATAAVPWGFYRDREGRTMQVSFDFGRRVWLGVGYAPRRTPAGHAEMAPAAFDFGVAYDKLSADGRTRRRFRALDGEVRLHPFGLDITGFRYDLSHRYQQPLLRITTFFGEPERHDLDLNIGLFAEALRFEVAPRGVAGEQGVTLATFQGTLDLWQSADLRSYLRLRAGPGLELRLGPWGDEARMVGSFPQAILEGNLIFGDRALQQLTFKVRGDFFRSATWTAQPLPGDWLVDGEAAYELIFVAINDQPVSLRLAAQAGVREDAPAQTPPDDGLPAMVLAPGWEWKGTAGIRMSFFSPPLPRVATR
jgi:hypothetical protein